MQLHTLIYLFLFTYVGPLCDQNIKLCYWIICRTIIHFPTISLTAVRWIFNPFRSLDTCLIPRNKITCFYKPLGKFSSWFIPSGHWTTSSWPQKMVTSEMYITLVRNPPREIHQLWPLALQSSLTSIPIMQFFISLRFRKELDSVHESAFSSNNWCVWMS